MDGLTSQGWAGAYDKESVERFLVAATAERDRLRDALIALRTRRLRADQHRGAEAVEIVADAQRAVDAIRAAAQVRVDTILANAEVEATHVVAQAWAGREGRP